MYRAEDTLRIFREVINMMEGTVKTLGDLRRITAQYPDDAIIAIDIEEEFHDFNVETHESDNQWYIALSAV